LFGKVFVCYPWRRKNTRPPKPLFSPTSCFHTQQELKYFRSFFFCQPNFKIARKCLSSGCSACCFFWKHKDRQVLLFLRQTTWGPEVYLGCSGCEKEVKYSSQANWSFKEKYLKKQMKLTTWYFQCWCFWWYPQEISQSPELGFGWQQNILTPELFYFGATEKLRKYLVSITQS